MATTVTKVPVVGDDGVVSEGRPLSVHCLPAEVGLRRQHVEYTCIDASQQFLAVGSVQGYVWVVDLKTSRLLREFNAFKGSVITVVKLNPVRDYVAYGTDSGFIRVERLSKIGSNKLLVQEKSRQHVRCIEWNHNGEDIFCGFGSGRLVQFNVKYKDGLMNHVPLNPDQYGSSIVQLSASENLLLVSTLERAFIVDIVTHKFSQVGRKERKSGAYGGCFVENGQTLLLARPGLRMWIADRLGKVLNTVAFKEILSSHLPAVIINSIPTSPLSFSRLWQFSTLHAMIGGRFIVTFQENALFIVDPMNGVIVGTVVLQDAIKSISTSGGFLYILSSSAVKAIVRVAVHHSYVTMECEKIPLQSAFSTPSTSVHNSPVGSLENLVNGVARRPDGHHSSYDPYAGQTAQPREGIELSTDDSALKTVAVSYAKEATEQSGNIVVPVPIVLVSNSIDKSPCDPSSSQLAIQQLEDESLLPFTNEKSEDQLPTTVRDKEFLGSLNSQASEVIYTPEPKKFIPQVKVQFPEILGDHSVESVYQTDTDRGSRLKVDGVKLKFEQGAASTSPTLNKEQANPIEGEGINCQFDFVSENSRRLRMSQAAGEDIVADNKSNRKKRRKTKGKKLFSDTSSTSVSMEKLEDIVEEQVDEQIAGDVHISISSNQVVFSKELHDSQNDSSKDDLVTEKQKILNQESGSLINQSGISSCAVISGERVVERIIENESGQQFSDDVKLEKLTGVSEDTSNWLDGVAGGTDVATGAAVDVDKAIDAADAAARDEVTHDTTVAKSLSDVVTADGIADNLGVVSANIIQDEVTPFEEVSDNPLYQDTDEEQGSGEIVPVHVDKIGEHSTIQSSRFVLQPTLYDPLQNEETLETGTVSDRSRNIHFPQDSCSQDHPASHEVIAIDETDGCCVRDQAYYISDSSHESEPESSAGVEVTDSQVVDDFYQLCGALVENTAEQHPQQVNPDSQFSQASLSNSNSLSQISQLCEAQEGEITTTFTNKISGEQSMDIWVPVPFPSRHSLHSVSLSDVLLWAVDSRGRVFCTTTSSRGKNWQMIKKCMQQVASSPSGRVVWATHHQNAYVRLGIGMNPAGSTWKNVTKNTSLAHKIKQLAVEESSVWAVTVDGHVLYRKGVEERNPEGKVWQEVSRGMHLSFINCCKTLVWALTGGGKVFVREGITPSSPSGKKWAEIKSPSMIAVSVTSDGVVWGINNEGSVGFRTGVNPSKPGGRGPWWEVTVNSYAHAASPLNSLWQVMSADGNHLFSSLVSLPQQHQAPVVSASAKAGVVVLEAGHRLSACWRMATGYHYTTACKEGIFQFNTWSRVAAGGTSLWFVRNDGDLYCLSPGSKLKRVEVPASVELIGASPNCMWVISKDMVWSRQGMTAELPEGISFDYIELSTLLHDKKLRSVACGKKVAWGIDSSGVPHFRFGVHAREPGTGMSPAWVPVEDHPGPLLHIAVCPDDWLVWACDEEHGVYVRSGVTVDFPVGRKWVRIPKQKIRELAATNDRMYGLTPDGELMCRYGISENNVQGAFWRKLPGKYEHITTGAFGELWTLDGKGQVWKQEWKVVQVSDMHADFDPSVMGDPDSWEFV